MRLCPALLVVLLASCGAATAPEPGDVLRVEQAPRWCRGALARSDRPGTDDRSARPGSPLAEIGMLPMGPTLTGRTRSPIAIALDALLHGRDPRGELRQLLRDARTLEAQLVATCGLALVDRDASEALMRQLARHPDRYVTTVGGCIVETMTIEELVLEDLRRDDRERWRRREQESREPGALEAMRGPHPPLSLHAR